MSRANEHQDSGEEHPAWIPLRLRDVTVGNRVWLSPMCQYSADTDGVPTTWHTTHYGARAIGGFGMVMVECTAVAADMRTTPADLGIWNDTQVAGHRRLTELISSLGSVPALQLGAAGRKSSHGVPWDNSGTRRALPPDDGGWQPLAPSPLAFARLATPRAMTSDDGDRVLDDLRRAARNADRAGYQALALQGANGYLFHQFLSPLSNKRDDDWGGDRQRRLRFPLAMAEALRSAWPDHKPLLLRIPATDLLDGGLLLDDAVDVAAALARVGVDVVDLESGTLIPEAPRPDEPLHNARYGPTFRRPDLTVAASGGITNAERLADAVPRLIDIAFVGRSALLDPHWALRTNPADAGTTWPQQYRRALPATV